MANVNDWRTQHRLVMTTVLKEIFSNTDGVVLKGGTSLLYCYGLNRFSEDLDFDSEKVVIQNILTKVTKQHNWSLRIAKDTATVKRYMLNYGGIKPLKIEVSYRTPKINRDSLIIIKGIQTYNIRTLFNMKLQAYGFRDTLRDLYDITYIYFNFKNNLTTEDLDRLSNALYYKDLEYVQGLLSTQTDELINNTVLEDLVVRIYYELGIK